MPRCGAALPQSAVGLRLIGAIDQAKLWVGGVDEVSEVRGHSAKDQTCEGTVKNSAPFHATLSAPQDLTLKVLSFLVSEMARGTDCSSELAPSHRASPSAAQIFAPISAADGHRAMRDSSPVPIMSAIIKGTERPAGAFPYNNRCG